MEYVEGKNPIRSFERPGALKPVVEIASAIEKKHRDWDLALSRPLDAPAPPIFTFLSDLRGF